MQVKIAEFITIQIKNILVLADLQTEFDLTFFIN